MGVRILSRQPSFRLGFLPMLECSSVASSPRVGQDNGALMTDGSGPATLSVWIRVYHK